MHGEWLRNALAMAAVIVLLLIYMFIRVSSKTFKSRTPEQGAATYTLDSLTDGVKEQLHQLTHGQLADLGLHDVEYRKRLNKQNELKRALKGCVTGDISDKQYVKSFIRELLRTKLRLDEQAMNLIIPFDHHEQLTSADKFDIILFLFKQEHQDDALSRLLEKYELAVPRVLEGYGEDPVYAVIAADIDLIYEHEIRMLTAGEKLDLIVQRLYQHYKGFSVIDELREQRIDGISGGVSGVVGRLLQSPIQDSYRLDEIPMSTERESIWLFYKGVSIHLSFLSFDQPNELRRVCQNIYKFNHPGQLTEAVGYKVNEMKDGSRVVVVRPPFSEGWAFFVRKFDVQKATLAQLIQGDNAEMAVKLLAFLMKGSRITAVTGSQGSGKTTLLMAMIQHIYATYPIRVQEMSFELQLRKLYSRRNILSFRETAHISGQQGLDLQKKTDGTVNILGEVASDEVAAWMIQMSQVASLFTVFTHHAKTFPDLILSLRNSLLKCGIFQQEQLAEEQVVQVVHFDVHLKRTHDGRRFIERVTECLPGEPDTHGIVKAGSSRNVLEYRDGAYYAMNPLSRRSIQDMEQQMQPQDLEAFRAFVLDAWGESA
ncbi:Flp pilus assembly complex ATPase component TadA [Paenibacillus sp. F411]|uniref:ATPase, T2SS/T4P/T4SS family n=1 Tax=Paenibacillus sp. F411 TaxID=2820239 RepID=UPI001AAE9748|nr:ATPase, T2SS/T4P/T4SS family [Paenibacillus sp. F411]MBO2943027.1 Flp pilus assembly complex ATPase component TadA [Paenibacillus sp. F411]